MEIAFVSEIMIYTFSPNDTSPEDGYGKVYGFSQDSYIYLSYLFAAIVCLIFLVGVPGNMLMLLVLVDTVRNSIGRISAVTSILIINIAVCDLIFLLFNIPVKFFYYTDKEWRMGAFICVANQSVAIWTIFSSFYGMVAISVTRYIAVVHPSYPLSLPYAHISFICLVIWLLGFVVSIPFWVSQRMVQIWGANYCISAMTKTQLLSCFSVIGGVAFFPAMFFMILCYAKVIYSLWSRRAYREHTVAHLRANRKVTAVILSLVIAFVLMWTPCWIVMFLKTSLDLPKSHANHIISNVSALLANSNCCVCPIIYFSLSEHFGTGLKKLFNDGFGKHPVEVQVYQTKENNCDITTISQL